jgi:DNA (cytosine-5)-methyltransferase 1
MRDKRAWKKKDNQRERQSFIEHRANGIDGDATNANGFRLNQCDGQHEEHAGQGRVNAFNDINENDERGNAADTMCERLQGSLSSRKHDGQQWNRSNSKIDEHIHTHWKRIQFENFPTQPPICGGDDGISRELDGVTFSKWRNESIKAYGNAIVPQVVHQIFKSIEAYERTLYTNHMGGHALCNPRMDGETDT